MTEPWTAIPLFATRWLEIDMRVPNEFLHSVVFVGVERRGAFTPLGTGFLCGYTVEEFQFPFLVTAEHVVSRIAGDTVYFRANRRNGGAEVLSYPKKRLITHTDKKNDLAVLPISNIFESFEVMAWRLDREREERVRAGTWTPAPGDEVTTVGLYTSHYGLARNIPVIRVGHIAMMPGEPVATESGYVAAYLVETKSIAGLSGSPVVLQVPRVRFGEHGMQALNEEISMLIGVMLGYHVVESAEDQITVQQFQGAENFKQTAGTTAENNTGLAVVVPIERVFEIMETDTMKAKLRESVEFSRKKAGFRAAGAIEAAVPVERADANPSHKEDFMATLGEAAQPRAKGD